MAAKAQLVTAATRVASNYRSTERTRERLIEVGTKLFASRGLEGTTIRDLAGAAEVNVAAVHYHFGGKDQLYADVVERVFAELKGLRELTEHELATAREAGTRAAATESLERCIRALLSILFNGNRPSWGGAYLQREAIEPTTAMRRVLERFIRPASRALCALVELIRPDLAGSETTRFIVSSIVGQCLHYQQSLPIALATHDIKKLTPDFLEKVTAHVSQFSLSALLNCQREEAKE